MKQFLSVFFLFKALCGIASGQTYETLKLNTDKPEVGREIKFVYNGVFSKKIDPRITLYFEKNGRVLWKTLNAKYNGVGIEGSFIIPDTAMSICLRARNNRDTAEIFVFNIYKNGKVIKGSLASSARFYSDGAYGIRDPQKATELYRAEAAQYPDEKTKNLLAYYDAAMWPGYNNPAMRAEMEKTWPDSIANGKNEQFLVRLLKVRGQLGSFAERQQLEADIIKRFPQGETAFSKDGNKLTFDDWQLKYPDQVKAGKFDIFYSQKAKPLFNKGDIAGGESYLKQMHSKSLQKDLYLYAASQLLRDKRELQKAEEYVQQAIALLPFDNMPYYMFDGQDWNKTRESLRGYYLDISAQIQYFLGNKAEAIKRLKIAEQISANEKIKEHLLQCLIETGDAKAAVITGSRYVETGKTTEMIKKYLQEAYRQTKGNTGDYETWYNALLKKQDVRNVLLEAGKLNVPSIDFTLKDTDGKPVTLSSYKGKPVVLYFYTMNFITPQRKAYNAAFSKMIADYAGSDIVFLAIDESSVSKVDETNGMLLRIKKVNDFMAQNNLNFKVLLDVFLHNPYTLTNSYYQVGDTYTAESGGQIYIIDKTGMVRYKSYPYFSMPLDKFASEIYAAVKLVE